MSKSNHFDHDNYIHINYSDDKEIKRINGYFKEIQYLVHSYNSEKEHDSKTLVAWLEKMHTHFDDKSFNHVTFSRLFDDVTSITGRHPMLKTRVLKYIKDHDKFRNDLLVYTEALLLKSSARELCHILGGLSKLEITPSPTYMLRWFSVSHDKLGDFTVKDIKQSIRSLARLHFKPGDAWMHAWFSRCDLLIDKIAYEDYESFGKILCAVGSLQITPEAKWFTHFMKEIRTYLTSLKRMDDIFFLSQSFTIEAVCKESRFIGEWFDYSFERIESAQKEEIDYLCVALFYITKLDYEIPQNWIDHCISKITNQFDQLSLKGLSYALYAMALLQLDVQFVRPFLEKSKKALKLRSNEFCIENNNLIEFKSVMLALFYFKIKKFDLGLDINQHSALVEELKMIEHGDPSEGEEYVQNILNELSIYDAEKEYWIDVIMDKVDFYLKSQKKICEFDGKYHLTQNGTANRLTVLKTFVLESYGYNLIRLDFRDGRQKNKQDLLDGMYVSQNNNNLSSSIEHTDNVNIVNLPESLRLIFLREEVRAKSHKDIYDCWMPELTQHAKECEVIHFGNLMGQLGLLVHSHNKLKQVLHKYYDENTDFRNDILEKSLKKAESASVHELLDLLHSFERLGIAPNELWINAWSSVCCTKMHEFTMADFEHSFSYFDTLKIKRNQQFQDAWCLATQDLLSRMSKRELCEFAQWCVSHKVELSSSWVNAYKNRILSLLPEMKTQEYANILFTLPNVFSIKEIQEDNILIQQWFIQTESMIQHAEPSLLINAFFYLSKLNITINENWFYAWQYRVESMFYSLGLHDVERILYGMALMEYDILKIKPILGLSQKYFSTREPFIFQKASADEFFKTMIAINYFDICGYKILINVKNYKNLYEGLFSEVVPVSTLKDAVEAHLKDKYFSDVQRHVRVDVLLKCVDFVVPSHNNLVIEIERNRSTAHIAKSRLIDALLTRLGHPIIRLCYQKIKEFGNAYVDEEIKYYLENTKNISIKRDIFEIPVYMLPENIKESLEYNHSLDLLRKS